MRVILNGGLGNQLFQLSEAYNSIGAKEVDVSIVQSAWFQKYVLKQRPVNYELGNFLFDGKCIKTKFSYLTFVLVILHKVLKAISGSRLFLLYDDENDGILNIKYGYFQDVEQAKNIAKKIKINPDKIDQVNLDIARKISDNNSLCIHVRKGDYSLPENGYFSQCSSQYYQSVINHSSANKIYVFSNDTAWCRSSRIFPEDTVYIEHNVGSSAYLDVFLISNAHEICIANSTFSQWAALLSDAMIYCPKHYYNNRESNHYLDSWILMDN
ncbi:alpha-1,2-fucosyltransferase [Vibrio vulnificus]|uniref:alpha-1,2-fucosyltransferase n=1 Tax=Vibrio vulnificus TaxID=672 RepID=UPI00287AE409|nr:alpha-1,2-fucosyltransferase [Vibrio vulnificus]MDS1869993.1 alpha-1,2-fucosyltransferase [Vibrio vulnificus]